MIPVRYTYLQYTVVFLCSTMSVEKIKLWVDKINSFSKKITSFQTKNRMHSGLQYLQRYIEGDNNYPGTFLIKAQNNVPKKADGVLKAKVIS